MGLSGISTWGSDIGGYFALGTNRLTPELLDPLDPVRRRLDRHAHEGRRRRRARRRSARRSGSAEILPHWHRWARLHTQLQPVPRRGDRRATAGSGMPVMAPPRARLPRRRARRGARGRVPLRARPARRAGARAGRDRARAVPAARALDRPVAHRADVPTSRRRPDARTARGCSPAARDVTLPAPLDELPLLARAGAVLPLLSPDVDTLADYGEAAPPGVVRLADRRDRLHLLAFPRGRRTSAIGVGRAGALESSARRTRRGAGGCAIERRARAHLPPPGLAGHAPPPVPALPGDARRPPAEARARGACGAAAAGRTGAARASSARPSARSARRFAVRGCRRAEPGRAGFGRLRAGGLRLRRLQPHRGRGASPAFRNDSRRSRRASHVCSAQRDERTTRQRERREPYERTHNVTLARDSVARVTNSVSQTHKVPLVPKTTASRHETYPPALGAAVDATHPDHLREGARSRRRARTTLE